MPKMPGLFHELVEVFVVDLRVLEKRLGLVFPVLVEDDNEPGLADPELLRELAGRMPLAVVTGRPRGDAHRFLAEHGISGIFSAVVVLDDAPSKPDPAPVKKACGCDPAARPLAMPDQAPRAAGFELNYGPRPTAFATAWRDAGRRCLDGRDLLADPASINILV